MATFTTLRLLNRFRAYRSRLRRRPLLRSRLAMIPLEERVNPATVFVVDTPLDVIDDTDDKLSLREAILAANASGDDGDMIVFDPTVFDGSKEIKLDPTLGDLLITDDVTIDGAANGAIVTIDGGGQQVRIFSIDTTGAPGDIAVTLNGLKLVAGNGTGTILANDGKGGAIFISDGEQVTITNTTISESKAEISGGAIYNGNGSLTLNSVTLGGMEIFSGNKAGGNNADEGGGGLYNAGGTVTILNSTIQNNQATGTKGSGGGILNNGGSISITGGSISLNKAIRAGGGIEDRGTVSASSVTLSNVTVATNFTGSNPGNGGGLHVTAPAGSPGSTVTVTGGIFSNNFAAREGGGLWADAGGTLSIQNTIIVSNVADGPAVDDGGGGVFNNGGTVVIENAKILSNIASGAKGSGGGIQNLGGKLTVSGGTIAGNTAVRAGGGIEDNSTTGPTKVTLTDVSVIGNFTGPAPGNGGGLHVTAPTGSKASIVTVTGGVFSNNVADQEGGGLWGDANGTLIIDGTTIIENTANAAGAATKAQGGGGVFNNGGKMQIANAVITDNISLGGDAGTLDDGGGGLFNRSGGTVLITDTQISNNVALMNKGNGGGIMNVGATSTISITGGSITDNQSARAGGGIETIGGKITLDMVTMSGNVTGINGGAVHISGAGVVTAVDSTFELNVAGKEGGGLWNSASPDASITLIRSTVNENKAKFGGGLFNLGAAGTIRLINSTVSGNAATETGGGIDSQGGAIELFNSTIGVNTAGVSGGGLNVQAGTAIAESTLFALNKAPAGPDVNGAITAKFSLLSTSADAFIAGTDNLLDVNPQVGLLADNGGPTRTHALLPGSPAIDAGDNPQNLLIDQRGFSREVNQRADIGAFEFQSAATITLISDPNPSVEGELVTFTATLETAPGSNPLVGPVEFFRNGTLLGEAIIVDGVAKFATADLPIGTHTITAVFGTAPFPESTSNVVEQVVQPDGPVGTAPFISAISDRTTTTGQPITVTFFVADLESPPDQLVVTATSDNPDLIPDANIQITGDGFEQTLTATPVDDQIGTATITITVTDPDNQTSTETFTVTVLAPAELEDPFISPIPDRTTITGQPVTVIFFVSDPQAPAEQLVVTATSDNPDLIPDENIQITTTGLFTRTMTLTPVDGETGIATITVTAQTEDERTTTTTFTVSVLDPAELENPFISPIPDQETTPGTPVSVTFFVADAQIPADQLVVTATSDNPDLIPGANIQITATGLFSRTMTLTPIGDETGTATITVTVDAGDGRITTETFTVSVAEVVTTPPVISDIPDQQATAGQPTTITFFVADAETPADQLQLSAATSDPDLIPLANIVFGGSGNIRTVTFTPVADQTGTATITITVTDAEELTASSAFDVTVVAPGTPPTITPIADQTTVVGTPVTVSFTIDDAETPVGQLTVMPTSSNTQLIPNENLLIGGVGANRTLTITPVAGLTGTSLISVTVMDPDGFMAVETFTVTVTPIALGTPVLVGYREFAVGSDVGAGTAILYNPDKTVRFSINPFGADFTGGVRVAAADFNGDGIADLVVGTGPGVPTQVRVFDGVTKAELFSVAPFEASFTGGVFVAAGDLTGDGRADLVITPDQGGGPRVRVFEGKDFGIIADFFGIEDPAFRGGARAAVGDVNGDGVGDLVVAAGFQGGPRVAAFSGKSLGGGQTPVKLFNDFFAFEQTLRNGVFIAVGDLNADGFADIIAGGGPGGGPRVTVFSSKDLVTSGGATLTPLANFFGGDPNNRGGIRIAVKNLDGDDRADIVVGSGEGAGSRVSAYLGTTVAPVGTPPTVLDFDAFPGFTGGVFVG